MYKMTLKLKEAYNDWLLTKAGNNKEQGCLKMDKIEMDYKQQT